MMTKMGCVLKLVEEFWTRYRTFEFHKSAEFLDQLNNYKFSYESLSVIKNIMICGSEKIITSLMTSRSTERVVQRQNVSTIRDDELQLKWKETVSTYFKHHKHLPLGTEEKHRECYGDNRLMGKESNHE